MLWLGACLLPFPPRPTPDGGPSESGAVPETGATDPDPDGFRDEFSEDSRAEWTSVHDADPTLVERALVFEVNGATAAGQARLVPAVSGWYEEYRGAMFFRLVEGDFVATAHVEVFTAAGAPDPPAPPYSYAGLIAREPYRPGYPESYVMTAVGAFSPGALWQTEAKTVIDGVLNVSEPLVPPEWDYEDGRDDIGVARVGDLVAWLIRRDPTSGAWAVRAKDCIPLASTLEVGMAAAADGYTVDGLEPPEYDAEPVTGGEADVDARWDWFEVRPVGPVSDPCGAYVGGDGATQDAALLALLGLSQAG